MLYLSLENSVSSLARPPKTHILGVADPAGVNHTDA